MNNFSEAVKTKKRLTFSAFSKGGLSHLEPVIFNAVFGSNLKAVTGYPSGGAQRLAVKNGEVNGFCTTFQTVKSTEIGMFEGDAKCCKVMIIAGNQKIDHRLAKGVPIAELLAKELGKSESDIAMLRVLNATNRISIVQGIIPLGHHHAHSKVDSKNYTIVRSRNQEKSLSSSEPVRGPGLPPPQSPSPLADCRPTVGRSAPRCSLGALARQ